jgi:hypothetical protein
MATASVGRVAGIPARVLRGAGAFRAAALAALLLGAPALARGARAQEAAVRASAKVITSVVEAGLLPDSAAVARASLRAVEQLIPIAGVGVLDVRSGPGQAIRVARGIDDPLERSAVVVQVFCVGS